MPAQVLNGKDLAAKMRKQIAAKAAELTSAGRPLKIASILVAGDDASAWYVRNQAKTAEKAGVAYQSIELSADISADGLEQQIRQLNDDTSITGIILQVPLPKGLDGALFQRMIAPEKDIEGVTPYNLGLLALGGDELVPCTARAAVELVIDANLPIAGKHCVVLGRSNIVGKPLALMMLQRHATVSVCHSRTPNLAEICRQGDIVMSAMGAKPHVITGDMIKPGAVVVDIATIPTAEGSITGDVDSASVSEVASWLAPVPGGVGPVTVCMLLRNALIAAGR